MDVETKQLGILAITFLVFSLIVTQGCQLIAQRQAQTIIDMGKAGLCARPGTSNEGNLLNVYYEKCVDKK